MILTGLAGLWLRRKMRDTTTMPRELTTQKDTVWTPIAMQSSLTNSTAET